MSTTPLLRLFGPVFRSPPRISTRPVLKSGTAIWETFPATPVLRIVPALLTAEIAEGKKLPIVPVPGRTRTEPGRLFQTPLWRNWNG